MDPARVFFHDASFDGQFARTLNCAYADAADLGEAFATARRIGAKSTDAAKWYDEWSKTAIAVEALAANALASGNKVSAARAFLRASEYYRQAFYFSRGDLDAPALMQAYDHHVSAFRKAASLIRTARIRAIDVPFEGAQLPGYFISVGRQSRPTIFMPCGYDSTAESGWFQVPDAIARGYNVLIVEGPGQGGVLYHQRIFFRPDYEAVASAVLDWAVTQPEVDSDQLVIFGRSFAGYLAPRAAAYEHRFAALVCDPAQPDMGAKVPTGAAGAVAPHLLAAQMKLDANRREFFQSRMAAHGVDDIAAYFDELRRFTMTDVADDIRCPTLLVESANDFAGGSGPALLELLTCDKELVMLTADEGADGHCAGLGQSIWAGVVYDWLAEVLKRRTD